MKFLLDHMLPHSLRDAFAGHEVVTARYRGWDSLTNGELLAVAEQEFDVLVTLDKHIQSQQPTHRYNIAVAVLDVHPPDESRLSDAIDVMLSHLNDLTPRRVTRIVLEKS